MTLVTNVTATSLLAYRIWRVNREVSRYRASGRLASVLRVIIESGAIYSMTIIAALVTFVVNSPGVYVLLDMISPIICIVFNMIIIRVGFATDRRLPVVNTTVQGTTIDPSSQNGNVRVRPSSSYPANSRFEMKSLAVEITQYIETDADTSSVADIERKSNSRLIDDTVGSSPVTPTDSPGRS